MPTRIVGLLATVIGLPLLFASAVLGSEPTRPQYVDQAEPICKANTVANRDILEGTRQNVRDGKLKLAGGKFSRAARALDRTIGRLESLPRPLSDEDRLARWFVQLNEETELLEKVANRLRKGSTVDLGKYVLEMRHIANKANNVVLTFGFEYCLLQPARYL